MTEDEQTRILYLAAIQRLDHERRRWVRFGDDQLPTLMVVVLVAILAVGYGIAADDLKTTLVSVTPAIFLFSAAATHQHSRNSADQEADALALRLKLGEERPPESLGSKTGDQVEARLIDAASQIQIASEPSAQAQGDYSIGKG